MHELRLHLTHRIADYVQVTLRRDPDAAFVFNRFHVSHAVWRKELSADPRLEGSHDRLVEKLARLPLQILHAVLDEDEVDARSRHVEREALAWRRFVEERLEFHGDTSAGKTWFQQQDEMTRILTNDGLPFRQLRLADDTKLDVQSLLLPDS